MTAFGTQLREWRRLRGISQLDLAARADVSQRHISFLETGRSRPSPEMVVHLGVTLDVPAREQNLLLNAAGHAPAYSETPLADLSQIETVLDHMLRGHEPNMAIVLDRKWDLVRANTAAMRFTSMLFEHPPAWMTPPLNLMRLSFHPEGLRTQMVDWESTAASLQRRLERDAASHPRDHSLADLLQEINGYPGVEDLPRGTPAASVEDLLVPLRYRIAGEEVALFSTIATIGDAHDLTLSELRIETFWPLDEASAATWNRLIGQ